MSEVPLRVQQQAEEAARIIAEAQNQNTATPAALDTAGAQEPPEHSTPAAQNNKPEDDFEQKYKVLQGKFNAEVPRLQQENTRLQAQNTELSQTVASLNERMASLEQMAKKEVDAQAAAEFAAMKEEFGEGLIEMVRKVARSEAARSVDGVAQHVEQINKTQQRQSETTYETQLYSLCPDWAQINEDPGFIKWLDEIEGLSGLTRNAILQQAHAEKDAIRVASFFNTYKEIAAQGNRDDQASQGDLGKQVTPDTNNLTGAGPGDTNGVRPYWTQHEINEFYNRRGEFYGISDEEAAVIERDIFAAQKEGRYRP